MFHFLTIYRLPTAGFVILECVVEFMTKNVKGMFDKAKEVFHGSISSWDDVSNGTNMAGIFCNAASFHHQNIFHQLLECVSSGQDMSGTMFQDASSFRQNTIPLERFQCL
jgi:hypothetical protein